MADSTERRKAEAATGRRRSNQGEQGRLPPPARRTGRAGDSPSQRGQQPGECAHGQRPAAQGRWQPTANGAADAPRQRVRDAGHHHPGRVSTRSAAGSSAARPCGARRRAPRGELKGSPRPATGCRRRGQATCSSLRRTPAEQPARACSAKLRSVSWRCSLSSMTTSGPTSRGASSRAAGASGGAISGGRSARKRVVVMRSPGGTRLAGARPRRQAGPMAPGARP